jgi:hypothetical protein
MKVALSLALLSGAAASDSTSEYIGFVSGTGSVSWQKVTYPANFTGTSASDVVFTELSGGSPAELGSWDGLNLNGAPQLTGRAYGDTFYSQVNAGRGPSQSDGYPGGCVQLGLLLISDVSIRYASHCRVDVHNTTTCSLSELSSTDFSFPHGSVHRCCADTFHGFDKTGAMTVNWEIDSLLNSLFEVTPPHTQILLSSDGLKTPQSGAPGLLGRGGH